MAGGEFIVDERDSFGRTALHWSAAGEFLIATRLLLRAGAFVDIEDGMGITPIVYAAGTGNVEVVKLLLNFGANVKGTKALRFAIERSNSPECVDLLIKAGAKINKYEEPSLLHIATEKQNIRMMKILLNNGSDVDEPLDSTGQSPLSALLESDCCYPQLPVLSVLLENRAYIDDRDSEGRTPLAVAIGVRRRKQVILFLLQHAADPNIPDRRGCNAPLFLLLMMASSDPGRYHLHSISPWDDDDEVAEIAQYLLSYGAHPNRRDPCTQATPLDIAHRRNLNKTMKTLMKYK